MSILFSEAGCIPQISSVFVTPRFGVLGGSFDPPHYGHLALAETARVQLELSRVLFVPAGTPPHKRNRSLSPVEDRAAMTALAIADNPAFALSRVDIERPGPHYSVDMLALLRQQHPSVAEWFFLLGEDALHDLPAWYRPQEILEQATLAVMPRLGQNVDVAALTAKLPLLAERLVWLNVPPVHYSATDLRARVRAGLPLRYLVPPAVAVYIRDHTLYQ
jgi:nicotinate-nucleotide adenylyltransferase